MRKSRGFTLLELMTTVAISAILAAIAAPSLRGLVQDNTLSAVNNQLLGSLDYARSEAVKRDTIVCVCPISQGTSCGSSWAQGWMVFPQKAGVCDPTQTALQKVGALTQPSMTLSSDASDSTVAYRQDGSLLNGTTVKFTVCDSRGSAHARQLEVTSGGRALASSSDGQAVNVVSGASLTCS